MEKGTKYGENVSDGCFDNVRGNPEDWTGCEYAESE